MTGITSVPLPAYWSSKEPEQWRRGPLKTLSCTNSRCAANNADYATVFSEPPAKRPRRPCKHFPRSRSVSISSNPDTPVELERCSKNESLARCGDCHAPLVPYTQSASTNTTLTPPTPISVRTPTPGSYAANFSKTNSMASYPPPRLRTEPSFQKRSNFNKSTASAPPPSECGDDYREELFPTSLRKEVSLRSGFGEEYVDDLTRKLHCMYEQASTPDNSTGSETPAFTEITSNTVTMPASPPQNDSQEIAEALTSCRSITTSECTGELQEMLPESKTSSLVDQIDRQSPFRNDDVGSDSSASPHVTEEDLNISSDVRAISDRNPISSFYNVLYTPDTNTCTSEEQEADVYMQRRSAEQAFKLKVAVEIAILSAFVTLLLLACFPSFLSGLRYYAFGCCACTCPSSFSRTSTPSQHFWQLKWFERWVYRGAQNLLSCPSPQQALGSTVLK